MSRRRRSLADLVGRAFRRDQVVDLDGAIAALRTMRDPGAAPADRAELECQLGALLWERASTCGWPADDVSEAVGALADGLRLLPSAHPARTEVALQLALACTWRYTALSGPVADRDQAIALASEYLAVPDADQLGTAICRCVIAWLTISQQLTLAQGDLASATGEDVAGQPRPVAASRQVLGAEVRVADAEAALAQLVRIDDPAVLDEQMCGLVATIGAYAALILTGSGQPPAELDWIVTEIDRVAGPIGPDTPDWQELLAARAVLLAARLPAPDSDAMQAATGASDAILAAAALIAPEHLLRSPLLALLEPTLLRQVTAVTSAADVGAELERVLRVLEQLPADTPDLERTLIKLGTELLHATTTHRSAVPIGRVTALLEKVAGELAPGDPARVLAEGMSAGAIGLRAVVDHQPEILDDAAERLAQAAQSTPLGHVGRPLTVMGEAVVLADRYAMSGELRHLKPAEQKVAEFFDALTASSTPWPDAGRGIGHYVRGTLRMFRFRHFPEQFQLLPDAIGDLELAVEMIDDDNPMHARLVAVLGSARALHEMYLTSGSFQATPASSETMRAGFEQVCGAAITAGSEHRDYPALMANGGAGLILEALADRDWGKLDKAISMLAAACSTPALTTRERPAVLHAHGAALLLRYQMTMDSTDLGNAIDRLEEARRETEQEDASPHASQVLQSLAEAYRERADLRRGDVDRAVEVGLAALREHAGDVLLQDDDENALGAGRAGAVDAFAMARWFLGHGRPGPAVSAIEFGRGMVLHAATVGAALPGVLRSAGYDALAQEWEHERSRAGPSGPELASDLRYRTMLAIEGSAAEARLLATPSVEEIRAALAATGTDALVYLMPQDDDGRGMAVIVDRAGSVAGVPLPGLRTGPNYPLGVCEHARREADLVGASAAGFAAARHRWRDALGELCDWAWRTAIGPLLAMVPAASRGRRRIVFVPIGQLGLVPWHASRRQVGSHQRYACEEVAFSYAASARQFIDAAELLPSRWGERPVLVTDSRFSAYATEAGIEYIRASYYPAARVFGTARRLASGDVPGSFAATPQDVLSVLPGAGAGEASLLHFGCHGRAAVPVLDSFLDLGSGGKLAVREILRQARRAARPEHGGLVVLAACMSDLSEADYDEALTLATAFLSAGSAGVVGARWSVTEDQTALFMVLFHRALRLGAADPARALQAAQLWMLNQDREPPDGLPKILGDEARQPELADPAAWAAFAYQGR